MDIPFARGACSVYPERVKTDRHFHFRICRDRRGGKHKHHGVPVGDFIFPASLLRVLLAAFDRYDDSFIVTEAASRRRDRHCYVWKCRDRRGGNCPIFQWSFQCSSLSSQGEKKSLLADPLSTSTEAAMSIASTRIDIGTLLCLEMADRRGGKVSLFLWTIQRSSLVKKKGSNC